MRLLHTGDWHVGKTLARRSRIEEANDALETVVALAVEHEVDAVLVCGDVFEHLAPSPEAEKVVYDALIRFEERRIPVVLIAGNHDHPQRWRAVEPLLARFAVHVVSEVRRPERGGIVEIAARDGSTIAQVAVLPWVTERRLVGAAELMGLAEQPYLTYATEVARLLEALCGGFDQEKCNVVAAHLYVSGAKPGGERTSAYDRRSLRSRSTSDPGDRAVRGARSRTPPSACSGCCRSRALCGLSPPT
jgi:DNA repair protein SbcD/Mre11